MKRISGKNLVLVGFMGTGKTEVGRLVASALNRRFVDMDRLIADRQGMPVAEIFRSRGEAAFRALEAEAAAELAALRGLVISTGGGVVLSADNVARLRENGFVVWLDASVDVLRQRLQNDTTRPLLAGEADMAALYESRRALYRLAAHVRVDTGDKPPLAVAREIMGLIRKEEEKKSN
jgi:shikimate kinase